MKRILTLTLVIAATIVGAVACGSTPNANRNTPTTADGNRSSNVAARSEPSPNPSQGPTASPMQALTAWQEAINKGDKEAYKRTLSKSSIQSIDDGAKEGNETPDEYIKETGVMRLFKKSLSLAPQDP